MAIYKKGSVGLFFKGDPTLRDYFILDGRATNYGTSLHHGTPTSVVYKPSELLQGLGCADFNDVGYINLGTDYDVPVAAGTVMLWTKIRDNTNAQAFWQDGGGAAMDISYSAGYFRALINDGAWQVISVANTVLTPYKLHHLCMTWDSSNLKLYIDGKFVSSVAAGACTNQAGYDTVIGAGYDFSNPIHGYESEFAIFSRAVSSQENSQYYKWAISSSILLRPKLTVIFSTPSVVYHNLRRKLLLNK